MAASLDDVRKATAGQQVAKPKKTIFDFLEDPRVKNGLSDVAGKFMSKDRLLRLCVNAVKKTPLLLQCDPQSVLGAFMTSAALGLEPNTVQGQAYLIPYKKRAKVKDAQTGREDWMDVYDCQFQIGYRGFITLAHRSPYIADIAAEAVHEKDLFEYLQGSDSFLKYRKALSEERGALIGAFCFVRFENGRESACVLPVSEIYKIRGRSETYKALASAVENAQADKDRRKAEQKLAETPWVLWEDDMAAKSAIKKHCKQLPLAAGDFMSAAAEIDDGADVIDLKAMADPDVAKTVVEDGLEPPALEHQAAERFEFTAEPERETVEMYSRESPHQPSGPQSQVQEARADSFGSAVQAEFFAEVPQEEARPTATARARGSRTLD